MTLSDRLDSARLACGLTISGLAARAGVDRRWLQRVLRGQSKRGIYPDSAERLASALGVRAGWLVFGEEDE